jgi:hypothetical protein
MHPFHIFPTYFPNIHFNIIRIIQYINKITERNLGIQTLPGAEVRLHDITAKATLKYGNVVWVFKQRRNTEGLTAAQMIFLDH